MKLFLFIIPCFLLTIFIADESSASIIRNVNPGKNRVLRAALTFDDGPKEGYTEELLTVLSEKKVKATFFLLGIDALLRTDDVRKIDADGHVIANHSMTHGNMKDMTFDEIRFELKDCNDLLESVTGKRPRFMRPPGGQYNNNVLEACYAEKLIPVFWTNNPGDYQENWKGARSLSSRVIRQRNNGDIILLHLGLPLTVEALPMIIDSYHRAGYKFITLDEI
jgi:peptidoglycan/xylan/chitin deacetylase (PgdA/CDA1 family)